MGRWIAAAALWALAAGLFAGRTIAAHVDAGTEVAMDWFAMRAPGFLRPYLPERVPKLIEPRAHRPAAVASPRAADAPPSKEAAHTTAKEERSRRHR